jgi:hypothetical protein
LTLARGPPLVDDNVELVRRAKATTCSPGAAAEDATGTASAPTRRFDPSMRPEKRLTAPRKL